MTDPKRVLLPEIETGNAAADRIYRRLIDRRRKLVEPGLVIDSPELASNQAAETDAVTAADPSDDGAPRQAAASAAETKPMERSRAHEPGARAAMADRADDLDHASGSEAPPAHAAAVFLPDESGAGRPAPGSGPAGNQRSRRARERSHASGRAADPRRSARQATDDNESSEPADAGSESLDAVGGLAGWLHPRLARWEPESQTMRFVKEHPALAVAIGVPALILITRNGGLRRLVRYASSPAGTARIRQIATVAAAMGLLKKGR